MSTPRTMMLAAAGMAAAGFLTATLLVVMYAGTPYAHVMAPTTGAALMSH